MTYKFLQLGSWIAMAILATYVTVMVVTAPNTYTGDTMEQALSPAKFIFSLFGFITCLCFFGLGLLSGILVSASRPAPANSSPEQNPPETAINPR